MATVTHRVSTASTANGTSYASGAFTPAAGELLVVIVEFTGSIATPTMTNSAGLTITRVINTVNIPTTADSCCVFISDATAAASSQTVTFDCTGDAATGTVIVVMGVSGMTNTGTAALKQYATELAFAAAGTPVTQIWNAATLTTNPVIVVAANQSNPAALTPPTNWTEQNDTGYATPATGLEYASRDSGYASSAAITWGSTSATSGSCFAFELDASGGAVADVAAPYVGGGFYP